jgi:NTE family protein
MMTPPSDDQPPVSPEPIAANKRWFLKQISIFSHLNDEQLGFVASVALLSEHETGETLYRQGDPNETFYGLVSGRIRLFVRQETGREETVETLHRGDYFGTKSILTREPHSVTAQALNACILIKINRDGFEAILKQIPEVGIQLSTTLSKRVRQKDIPIKQVAESTLVSVHGNCTSGQRHLYAVSLSAALRRETGKQVIWILVDAGSEWAEGRLEVRLPVFSGKESFDPMQATSAIVKHDELGVDLIHAAHDPGSSENAAQLAHLLSYLTNLYHFVVVDLPPAVDRTVFKAMVQADYIHLLCHGQRHDLERAAGLLEELKKTVPNAAERLRIIVQNGPQPLSKLEQGELLGSKIQAVLPHPSNAMLEKPISTATDSQTDYGKMIRRIAREAGGVRIGVVLGSGAAMGIAHIGIIRALEREGIPVDIIAGSSIGALIGALWSAGYDSRALEKIANIFRTRKSLLQLTDLSISRMGLLAGNQVTRLLRKYLGDSSFRDLKIPMKIAAVDYKRREVVVFEDGPVVPAIRASVAIPGIFMPVQLRGRYLTDGGVLSPVPVDILRQAGVQKIIAVNTLPSPQDMKTKYQEVAALNAQRAYEMRFQGWWKNFTFELKRKWLRWIDINTFDILMHSIQGMEYVLAEAQCAQADVALHPTIPRINWWEFYNVDQLIRCGEETAMAQIDSIKKLIAD